MKENARIARVRLFRIDEEGKPARDSTQEQLLEIQAGKAQVNHISNSSFGSLDAGIISMAQATELAWKLDPRGPAAKVVLILHT